MQRDPFDGLTAFLAVAKSASFTAAAAALGVTPTAVSQTIKRLEESLGVLLFQRTTRKVALTDAGQSLAARLRPAAKEIEDAVGALHSFRGRPTGTIRMTAPRTSMAVVARLVTKMRRRFPEVGFELSMDDAFVDLIAEGFDVGVRMGDAVEKDMIVVRLTKSSAWSVVASPAYLAKHGRPQSPRELVEHRAIKQRMIASGVVYRWEFERRGKSVTVDVPGAIVANDVRLMIALAVEGHGLAYVSDELVERELAEGTLERVLEAHLTPGPGLFLYFPAGAQSQPKVRALLDVVAAAK